MAQSDITAGYGEGLDAKREALGPPGYLKLKTFGDTMQPDQIVAEVANGWTVRGGQAEIEVKVIEEAALYGGGTLAEAQLEASPVLGIDGVDYFVRPRDEGGIIPPTTEPRVWTVRARLKGTQ